MRSLCIALSGSQAGSDSLSFCRLAANTQRTTRSNATHVSFGVWGDKVVASYHADHAYSFDIRGAAADAPSAVFSAGSQSGAGQPLLTMRGFMPKVHAAAQ